MMKAAVLYGPLNYKIESIEIPQIGPKDVLVRVIKAGICGTDSSIYRDGYFVPGFPQIIGHEFSSVVEEIGPEVEGDIKIGDRVTGYNELVCGECFWCRRGEYHLCPSTTINGLGFGTQGCFAEYTVLRNAVINDTVYHIPNNLDDYEGAAIEPMAVGAGNIRFIGTQKGDKVVILGGGGIIGQSHLQMAKHLGATVAVIDISPKRLEFAKMMGADVLIDLNEIGDPVEYIIDLWGNGPMHWTPGDRVGGMADKVIECTGLPGPFTQAFKIVRPGGVVQIAGIAKKEALVDPRNIALKMIKVVDGVRSDLKESAELLSKGIFKSKPLMTHCFPLDNIVEAFEQQQRPAECLKVMIDVTG